MTTQRRDWAITAAALALLLAWDFAALDLPAARAFGSGQGFALRHHWLTQRVLHDGGRWVGFMALAAILINLWRPWWPGPSKRERWWCLGITFVCLLAVPAIKQISLSSCPWDLQEFGGVARYVSHWQWGVADGGKGHCFPSGHAIAAFAFFSGWFMLRGHHPTAARWWLGGVLVLGALFGLAQLARGAHYPSHTLWSAWLCWVICVVAEPLISKLRACP